MKLTRPALISRRLPAGVRPGAITGSDLSSTLAKTLLVAVFFTALHLGGLVPFARFPVLLGLLALSTVMSIAANARWAGDCTARQLHQRIAVGIAGITAIIYATGWGPVFAIGYIYAVVDNIRRSGTRATGPTLAWALAGMLVGQLAIAVGIAPTLIDPSHVHGLAVLAALGLVFTTQMIGAAYTEREHAQAQIAPLISERDRASEQILTQLETLTALYASAQQLSQSLDQEVLAEHAARTCVRAFGARLTWVGRSVPDGSVDVVAHFPAESTYPRRITVRWDDSPLGQGPVGRSLRTGFPAIVEDVAADPAFGLWREAVLAEGFHCLGGFPLVSRDKTFGVLVLHSDEPGFFSAQRIEFFQAYAHLVAAALTNARLIEETQLRLNQLQTLRDIDMAISGSLDLRVTLNLFLDKIIGLLRIDASDVLLLNRQMQTLDYTVGRGFHTTALQFTHLALGESHAGRAALERRAIIIPDLRDAPGELTRSPLLRSEGFIAYVALPLISKGEVQGVLEIFHRGALRPDRDWLIFLETLAGQAGIAIDHATMFDEIQRAHLDLIVAYDRTLEGWSHALDLRDKETEGHTRRVTELTLRLARAMGMTDDELLHVRRGALLHDIGKMGIPDAILLKPGPLTDEEWAVMRRHPVYAHELLSAIPHLRPALDIPYAHHEKWDGTGYPRGLRGEEIPLAARIFAVVDVWDALRSDRPYRPAWPEERVRAHLREQAGRHFDPKAVEMFLLMQV